MNTNDIVDVLPTFTQPQKPVVKLKKDKIRRKLPVELSATDFDETALGLHDLEINFDTYYFDANKDIKRLAGKFERYYFDETKKMVIKEIVIIHPDARVTLRSTKGIYKGIANYCMKSVLAINLFAVNDDEALCSQTLCYVGRHDYEDIECLYGLSTAINANNMPLARNEVWIPFNNTGSFPEMIKPDTLTFFKLEKKYPLLLRNIQTRSIKSSDKITWE